MDPQYPDRENPAPDETRSCLELTIVVPMLDEEEMLGEMLDRVGEAFEDFEGEWELMAVDDASGDATWELLKAAAREKKWLCGISLSRRAGQHGATMAGLEAARGRIVAVMDADLQVSARCVRELVENVRCGAEIAFAKREHRGEGFLKEKFGLWLNRFMARHSQGAPPHALSTFLAARRDLVERALEHEVRKPVTPYHLMLAGPVEVSWVASDDAPRIKGLSKYSLSKLFVLAMDIFFGYTRLPARAFAVAALLLAAALLGVFLPVPPGGAAEALVSTFAFLFFLVALLISSFLAFGLLLRFRRGKGPLYILREAFGD